MRYMLLLISTGNDASFEASIGDRAAMLADYNVQLRRAGVLLASDALRAPVDATRVAFRDGRAVLAAEPGSTSAHGSIGGYWVIQAKSNQEAVEWARRCPALPGWSIEVREVCDGGTP